MRNVIMQRHRSHRRIGLGSLRFVLFAVLLIAGSCRAQMPAAPLPGNMLARLADPTFESMGAKQGLPHDSVYGFAQDSRGLLWIATFGGLVRYDGYRMRTYLHNDADAASLPDNNVRGLLSSRTGRLWVATGNAGVASYDPATDAFQPLPKLPAALVRSHVFCMTEDADGSLWFGSQLGLARFNPQAGSYEIYGKAAPGDTSGLRQGSVFSVLRDRDGNLWVGGDRGLEVRRRGAVLFQPVDLSELSPGPAPPVWTIFEDAESRFWLGTDHAGLGLLDRPSMRVKPVPSLSGPDSLIGIATVRGMVEARPNQFWIATYGSGMIVYDAASQSARRYQRNALSPSPLANNFVRGVMLDITGTVWIGTDRGLSRVSFLADGLLNLHASPLRNDGLSGNEVRSVTGRNGRIWVGFDTGGFGVIEPDGVIHSVRPASDVRADRQSRREVLSLKAGEGTIFAGGTGLFAIDPRTLTYRPVADPLLDGQVINALLVEPDAIWAGTYSGLVRYDRQAHKATLFAHSASDPSSLSDNYVRDMLRGHDGSFWVTTRLGIDWMRPGARGFLHLRHYAADPLSIPSDNVQPIAADLHGRLWVGSIDAGLLVQTGTRRVTQGGETFDAPIFRALDRNNGFPSVTVLTTIVGTDGRIWSSTPRGLAVVDPGTLKIRTFTAADGLSTSSQNLFSSATLSDGTIVFPGDQGLVVVRPELLRESPHPGALALTELTLPSGKGSSVAAAWKVQPGSVLELSGKERGFQATFALLDFAAAQHVRYSYRLEGFDPDWSETEADSRVAAYTNLPSGDYCLLVRAVARDGQGPEATTAIKVRAKPSWTERWWFTVLKVLSVFALILAATRVRTRVAERRHLVLEEIVRQRTMELGEKQAELMEANRRLENLAMRDALTGLFNRRHFLEQADKERARADRSSHPFSVLMIDVDLFKQVNDRFGHAAGDQVLRELAPALALELRRTDLLARWGGEELVALLSDCDEVTAKTMAERLRAKVQDLQVTFEEQRIPISVSIGVSSSLGEQEIEDTLQLADLALYAAKRYGRNRVVASHDLASLSPTAVL